MVVIPGMFRSTMNDFTGSGNTFYHKEQESSEQEIKLRAGRSILKIKVY